MPTRIPMPISRDELYELYWTKNETSKEIAGRFNCSPDLVRKWLRAEGIKTKTKAEAQAGVPRPRPINVKLRTELGCRECGGIWQHDGQSVVTTCPYCGAGKDARDSRREGHKQRHDADKRKAAMIEWYANADNRKQKGMEYRLLVRKRAFFRICGSIDFKCVRCGCDDFRLLEINHKNGGGGKELQNGKRSFRFYLDIASGTRSTEDLELLCKPCNAIHALEMRFGPLPMKVVWLGTSSEPPD